MTPIQLPPFTLAMINPGSLARGVLLLALAAALAWAARRVKSRARLFMHAVVLVLVVQVVLVCNPWSWDVYAGILGARDVGWRQRDVILVERNKYLKKQAALDYLVVGSSQAGAIFGDYAADHPELDFFTMAGLFPLDFVLYREYIAAYRPQVILLHLSEFDMARDHSPRRAVMAPPQGMYLPGLFARLRAFPRGREYDQAVLEMAVGEAFPEFRYSFVFRGLVDKALGKKDAFQQEPPETMLQEADAEPGAVDRYIAELARLINPGSMDFNFFFLEEFLDFCAGHSIEVVILEGQYMPAAQATAARTVNALVRERLQTLTAAREGVAYIPRDAVFEFDDSDYVDMAHVKPEAGYEYARRLMDYLSPREQGAGL